MTDITEFTSPRQSIQPGWRRWVRPALIGIGAVVVNILVYILLPPQLLAHMGFFGYISAFLVAAIANASVIVPVPYYPVIVRLAQALDVWGVVLMAAAGSALGETVAFFVGRAGQGAAEHTRFYRWVHHQMQHPWRAALVLFLLAAPPNPAFDIAGLLAGALGLSLRMFLITVFLGRIVRMALVVFAVDGFHGAG
jgi:membrane protein YqaA with SNARE-associated domain